MGKKNRYVSAICEPAVVSCEIAFLNGTDTSGEYKLDQEESKVRIHSLSQSCPVLFYGRKHGTKANVEQHWQARQRDVCLVFTT